MPDCDFNEREFEFAINHELTNVWRTYLVGALPTIPTQVEEKAKGYDAVYRFSFGRIIFLQYKVASAANRRTGLNKEVWDAWGGPYLRAWLHADDLGRFDQHNRLVDLANSGEDVYYCAPLFYERSDLAIHALASSVWANSLLAPLRGVRKVTGGSHSISYPGSGHMWRLHSEIEDALDGEHGASVFDATQPRAITREALSELASTLRALVPGGSGIPDAVHDLGPLAEIDWVLAHDLKAVLAILPEGRPQRGHAPRDPESLQMSLFKKRLPLR